jgi:cation:H+ antiporter
MNEGQAMTLILSGVGLVILAAGAEMLVRGAARLALFLGISPLVVGLTVVAFATGSPELAVSVQSAWSGQPDIAVGNVVGSNILNILLVLGSSALIVPLIVSQQLVRIDVPLMIGASLLLYLLAWDQEISKLEGTILFIGMVAYVLFTIIKSRQETAHVRAEYEEALDARRNKKDIAIPQNIGLVLVGLILLVLGAHWLVEGAVTLARLFGVSELAIGLTVVAVGTSLPEVAASVVASLRGERDIAVGNVVGSNLFNILAVLGLTSMVAPVGLPISATALHVDIPIMLATAVACLPIFFTGHRINRWEGALFLGYYLAYTIYLIMNATKHDALPAFSGFMLGFVVPLTVITLAIVFWRTIRSAGS